MVIKPISNMANRTINLSKKDLLKKLQANKEAHIRDYNEAVIAYKLEVADQLKKLSKALKNGSMDFKLELIKPVNREKRFDEIIEMFEWENREDVDLLQGEFNDYVLDKGIDAISAFNLNNTYKSKFSL